MIFFRNNFLFFFSGCSKESGHSKSSLASTSAAFNNYSEGMEVSGSRGPTLHDNTTLTPPHEKTPTPPEDSQNVDTPSTSHSTNIIPPFAEGAVLMCRPALPAKIPRYHHNLRGSSDTSCFQYTCDMLTDSTALNDNEQTFQRKRYSAPNLNDLQDNRVRSISGPRTPDTSNSITSPNQEGAFQKPIPRCKSAHCGSSLSNGDCSKHSVQTQRSLDSGILYQQQVKGAECTGYNNNNVCVNNEKSTGGAIPKTFCALHSKNSYQVNHPLGGGGRRRTLGLARSSGSTLASTSQNDDPNADNLSTTSDDNSTQLGIT